MTQQMLVIIVPIGIVSAIFIPLVWYEIKQRRRQVETDTKVLSSFFLQQKRGQEHERLAKLFNKNPLLKALLEYAVTRHNITLRAYSTEEGWAANFEHYIIFVPEKILQEYNRPDSKIKEGLLEAYFSTEIGHFEHYKTSKLVRDCPYVEKREGEIIDCYYNERAAAAIGANIIEQITKNLAIAQKADQILKGIAKIQCSQCFPVISRGKCPKKQTIARMEEKLKDFFKN